MATGTGEELQISEHIFHSDVSVRNFRQPFKAFRLFRKCSVWLKQNRPTVKIVTKISGNFRFKVDNQQFTRFFILY